MSVRARWGTGCARPARSGRTGRADHVGAGRAGRAAPGERPAADGTRPAQTSDGLLGEGVGTVTRYRWVAARKAEGFPITMACRVAGVSAARRSTTGGPDRRPGPRRRSGPRPTSSGRSGRSTTSPTAPTASRAVTAELARRGRRVNHKRVERLMRAHGIVGVHKPAKVRTTIPAEDAPPLPDLVGRRFAPGRARCRLGRRHHLHPDR